MTTRERKPPRILVAEPKMGQKGRIVLFILTGIAIILLGWVLAGCASIQPSQPSQQLTLPAVTPAPTVAQVKQVADEEVAKLEAATRLAKAQLGLVLAQNAITAAQRQMSGSPCVSSAVGDTLVRVGRDGKPETLAASSGYCKDEKALAAEQKRIQTLADRDVKIARAQNPCSGFWGCPSNMGSYYGGGGFNPYANGSFFVGPLREGVRMSSPREGVRMGSP